MDYNFETLDKFLEDIKKLQKAKELLDKIYNEFGPYGDGEISDKTRYEMQDFYGFDDSE